MPPVLTITIREGTVSDIPEIARQRRRMCEDMNYTDAEVLSTMEAATADYLKKAIPEGFFHSWLAFDNGRVVAGGAVVIVPWPSHAYASNAAAPPYSTSTPNRTTAAAESPARSWKQ